MRLAITRSWIRVSRLLMVILLQSRNMNVPSGAGVGKNGAEERNQTHGPAPRYSENEPDIVRLRGIRSARHRRAWRRGASRRPDHRHHDYRFARVVDGTVLWSLQACATSCSRANWRDG